MSKVLAFLQNQWFPNPESAQAMFDRYKGTPFRNELVARFLFYKCPTGRRLKSVFGDQWCKRIVWDEASTRVAGRADGFFPADPAHMLAAVQMHRPQVVLAFGRIAVNGCLQMMQLSVGRLNNGDGFDLITGPHPTARGDNVMQLLEAMRLELETKIKS